MKVISFYYNFLQSCPYEKYIKTQRLQTVVSLKKHVFGFLQMVAYDPKGPFQS